MKFGGKQVACSVLTVALGVTTAFPNGSLEPRHPRQAQQSQSQSVQDIEERSVGLVIPTPEASVQFRLAGGGFVERTTDGGATWDGQMVSPNTKLNAGAAPGPKICWLVGREGRIFLTTDGTNWKKIRAPAQVDFIAVTALDGSSATVTAVDKRKFVTVNRGKS
jgi:hypothetical protein